MTASVNVTQVLDPRGTIHEITFTEFGDEIRALKKARLKAEESKTEHKYDPPRVIVPGRLAEPAEVVSGAKSLGKLLVELGYEVKFGYAKAINKDDKVIESSWLDAAKHKRRVTATWQNGKSVGGVLLGGGLPTKLGVTALKKAILADEAANYKQSAYEWDGTWKHEVNSSWGSTLEYERALPYSS